MFVEGFSPEKSTKNCTTVIVYRKKMNEPGREFSEFRMLYNKVSSLVFATEQCVSNKSTRLNTRIIQITFNRSIERINEESENMFDARQD